jgi:flagellar hook-associated protein 3 FlgL
MTRVSTLGSHEQLMALVREVQSRFLAHQLQMASGKKAQTFSGMAPELPQRFAFEDARSKVERYLANIATAEQRIKIADAALEGMEKISREMQTMLAAQPTEHALLANFARNALAVFASYLNQEDVSRALFAGSNVNGPAAQIYEPGDADPAPPFGGVPGGASYRYKIFATGAASDTAIKVSDSQSVTVQINANQPATNAFTRVLDALIQIADFTTATNPTPTQADVDAAKALLEQGLQGDATAGYLGFDGLRAQLAGYDANLALIKESHEKFLTYAIDAIAATEQVDLAEVAAKVNADRAALEASYSALARLNELSLLDYLR